MKLNKLIFAFLILFCSKVALAVFPDDMTGVVWLDPDISSWPATASLDMTINSATMRFASNKEGVWPNGSHPVLACTTCNASAWIFAKFGDTWYASTFEWLRRGSWNKADTFHTLDGKHTKKAVFSGWHPQAGKTYGLMTSGFARFDLDHINVRERSRIALVEWGSGSSATQVGLVPEIFEDTSGSLPLAPVVDLLLDEPAAPPPPMMTE